MTVEERKELNLAQRREFKEELEMENPVKEQTQNTEKLDRLIEAGALSVLSYSPKSYFAELGLV